MELTYPGNKLRLRAALVFSLLCWAGLAYLLQWVLPVALLGLLLVALLLRSADIARLRGHAVHAGPLQMPELNGRLLACCRRLHIEHAPELYVSAAPNVAGARSVALFSRRYVVLQADLLQSLESLPGALDFFIGRELGRLQRRHEVWQFLLLPAQGVPLLGASLERAWEYTCDRHGLAACENPAYARVALAALACGSAWKKLNLRSDLEQVEDTRGFWCSYHELIDSQPWRVKRMAVLAALADKQVPQLPRRHVLAWLLALFTPRLPRSATAGLFVLLLVIAGVVLSIPAYRDYQQRSAITQAYAATASLRAAIEKRSALQLRLPTLAELEAQPFTQQHKAMRTSIVPQEGGRIEFTFEGEGLSARMLAYPAPLQGSLRALDWHCSGTLEARLRPAGCAWEESEPLPASTAPLAPVSTVEASADAVATQSESIAPAAPLTAQEATRLAFNQRIAGKALQAPGRLQAAVAEHHQKTGAWPKSLAELRYSDIPIALDNEGAIRAHIVLESGGQIAVQIVGGQLNGALLNFKPKRSGDQYGWSCASPNLVAPYLPEGCR